MTQRYLKQAKSGYVTLWAPRAAKRKDLYEISEEEALRLLPEQQKTHAQKMAEKDRAEKAKQAAPIAEPETEETAIDEEPIVEDTTEEPIVDTVPETTDDIDADIKMLEEIRVKGRGKAQVEIYMKETYGIDIDRRLNLNTLVDQAIAIRNETLAKSIPA